MLGRTCILVLLLFVRCILGTGVEPIDLGSGHGQINAACTENVIADGLLSNCADVSFLDDETNLGAAVNALSDNAYSLVDCITEEIENGQQCPPILTNVIDKREVIEELQALIGTLVDESLTTDGLVLADYGLNQVFNCSSGDLLNKVLGHSLNTMQEMLINPGTQCTILVEYQAAIQSLITSNCNFDTEVGGIDTHTQNLVEIMLDFINAILDSDCTEYLICTTNCCDTMGTCVEEDSSPVCECPEGFIATETYECIDVNECGEEPCVPEASCTNSPGSFACTCPMGTFGNGIDACAASDFCDGVTCANGGTCNNQLTGFLCACTTGWQGTLCEDDVPECIVMPPSCENEGVCTEEPGTFTCECVPGFEGTTCETNTNECDEIPCDTNAFCSDTDGSFECTCGDGYSGDGFSCFPIITFEICDPEVLPPTGRQRVHFLLPINFDGVYYDSLWITENGVLIFSDSGTLTDPYDSQESSGLPYIAPFWDNYEANGNVFWRLTEDIEGVTFCDIDNLIERINEEFMVDFKPKVVLQVEWDAISMSPITDFSLEPNSFQCAILSDGVNTYLFFLYQPGQILFDPSTRSSLLNNAIIGYSNPKSPDMTHQIEEGFYRPDEDSTTGRLGEYIYLISAAGPDDVEVATCLNWINDENQFPITFWIREESCPWDLTFAVFDFRFSQIPVNFFLLNSLGADLTDYPLTYSEFVCFQSNQNFFVRSGVRCCYSLLTWQFSAGPLTSHYERRQVLSGFAFPISRLEASFDTYREVEISGLKSCCADVNSIYCYFYSLYRPNANINFYRPVFPIFWGFGDPHITTLSDYRYTFNGLGEYIVVEMGLVQMQGRAEEQLNSEGLSSGATIFTKFALFVPDSSSTIQVEPAGPTSTVVNVTINGEVAVFTENYGEETYVSEDIKYTKTSNTTYQITINETVSISFFSLITESGNLMSFTIRVPDGFSEIVTGLVGDFIFRNGTALNLDEIRITGRMDILNGTFDQDLVFPFGESWRVTEAESLFEYGVGEDYMTFNPSPAPVPPFLTDLWDNATPQDRADAEALCENSLGCVFDFLVTNNSALATTTEQVEAETVLEEERSRNTIPVITILEQDVWVNGTLRLEFNVHNYVNFFFNVSDADDDDLDSSFTDNLVGQNAVSSMDGIALHRTSNYTAEIIAAAMANTGGDLSIAVSDGVVSVTMEIPVIFCLCNNAGTCLWDVIEIGTPTYGVAACNCSLAYDGVTCDDDRDRCDPNPCVGNCTDDVAPDEGFTCGPCPGTLELQSDGITCADPDQCMDMSHNCDATAMCENLPNGFRCVCYPGFELNMDNVSCSNINECDDNPCPLNSNCSDTPGSFMCTCHPGFNQSDNCMNINECLEMASPCPNDNTKCVDTPGGFMCPCLRGFERPWNASDISECSDINECVADPPICSTGSTCDNFDGGFTCNCSEMYVMLNPTVCIPATCIEGCPANAECVDTDSGFECQCKLGRVLDEGVCRRFFPFIVRTIIEYRAEFRNLSSTAALDFIRDLKRIFFTLLFPRRMILRVRELRPGSTIVVFDLISNDTADDVEQSELLVEVIDAIESGQFNTSIFIGNPAIGDVNVTNVCEDLPPTTMTFEEILNSGAAIISSACNPNTIGLSIDLCLLENAGIGARDMVIGGPSQFPINEVDVQPACRPRVVFTNDGNLTALFLLFDLQACNPDVAMVGDFIEYTYHVGRISGTPSDSTVIQRFLDVCANLTCQFNRSYEIWSDPVQPLIRKINFDGEEAQGEFDITMELFRDDMCMDPLVQGDTVMVSDYIYFKVDHPGPNEDAFTLQASDCWATLSSDPEDTYRYPIIVDGCKSTMDSDAITVIANFNDTFVKAGFESFVWTNISDADQKIFVHCMVGLCLTDTDCGQTVCGGGKKKRSVENTMEQHLISLGPLTPFDPCQGHCEQKCSLVEAQPVCSCYKGYELSSNGITCYQTDLLKTLEEAEEEAQNGFFYSAVAVISVLATVLVVLMWRK